MCCVPRQARDKLTKCVGAENSKANTRCTQILSLASGPQAQQMQTQPQQQQPQQQQTQQMQQQQGGQRSLQLLLLRSGGRRSGWGLRAPWRTCTGATKKHERFCFEIETPLSHGSIGRFAKTGSFETDHLPRQAPDKQKQRCGNTTRRRRFFFLRY